MAMQFFGQSLAGCFASKDSGAMSCVEPGMDALTQQLGASFLKG